MSKKVSQNWYQTYYQMAIAVQKTYNDSPIKSLTGRFMMDYLQSGLHDIISSHDNNGQLGLADVAFEWTEQFNRDHANWHEGQWDINPYYDEIDDFIKRKLTKSEDKYYVIKIHEMNGGRESYHTVTRTIPTSQDFRAVPMQIMKDWFNGENGEVDGDSLSFESGGIILTPYYMKEVTLEEYNILTKYLV